MVSGFFFLVTIGRDGGESRDEYQTFVVIVVVIGNHSFS